MLLDVYWKNSVSTSNIGRINKGEDSHVGHKSS